MEALTSSLPQPWSLPLEIVRNAEYAELGIDDQGNIVVVWEESGFIKGGVLKIDNGLFSFIEASTSISTGGSALALDFSMNRSGKAVAVWLEGDTVQMSTLQTSDTSLKWSEPMNLGGNNTTHMDYPQVAVDEKGNTLVSWSRSDPQNLFYKFIEVVSQIGDNDWSTPTVLKEGTLSIFDTPRIAVNGGIGVAVWNIVDTNSNLIVEGALANIYKDPISWNDNKTLSDNAGDALNPQVAVTSSGRVTAIWRFYDDQKNYKIQCMNNDFYNETWGPLDTISDSNVMADGLQFVVAASVTDQESDLLYAYWSNMASSDHPLYFAKSTSQNIPWSVGQLTGGPFDFDLLGSELGATLFKGTFQLIWWVEYDLAVGGNPGSGSIQVGYPVLSPPKPPTLQSFILTKNNDLNNNINPYLMIASNDVAINDTNDTKGIIVAIWIETHIKNGQKILKGAYGQQSPTTSKMLMYWGVDEAFQSDLP